jgi:hypothetical protein
VPQEAPVDLVAAATARSDAQAFVTRLPEATAAFVGTLVEVGPPPDAWSGYAIATQALTFDVSRSLRGEVAGRVTVHHWIVAGGPEVGAKPGLLPAFTAVGEPYIVALGPDRDGRRMTLGEGLAPLPATPDRVEQAVAALAK